MFAFEDKDLDIEILEERIIEPINKSEKSKHIVFIHGFAIDSRCWDLYVEKNTDNYIHLINLPGHGMHEYVPMNLTFKFMVEIVKKYLKSVSEKYGPVILIGHSYGGAISITAASELKTERINAISKLILLAPYSKYSIIKVINKINLFNVKTSEDFLELQNIIFVDAKKTLPFLSKYLYEKLSLDFFRKNSKNFKWVMMGMSLPSTFYRIDEALRKIGKDSYFLFGSDDKLIDNEKTIERASPYGIKPYFKIYKDCGHAFFAEENDAFFNEIENIIKS